METMKKESKWHLWALGLIVALGLVLRIYQLGVDSFWTDEAGQAIAVLEPAFSKMVEGVKSHAMAMPLDYIVARIFSAINTSEFVFRLPAAIWGTLSVAFLFVLSRRFVDPRISIIAALILAINPLHIRYSQELRFYSALFFFYLLSTVLLLAVLENEKKREVNLLGYVLVTAVGAYFHPYVLLTIVNGFFVLLFMRLPRAKFLQLLGFLFVGGFFTGLLFLPGYLYFGSEQTYNFDLLQWHRSFWHVISAGFGWSTFRYTQSTPNVGYWEWFNLIFTGIGLIFVIIRYKKYARVLGFVVGIAFQVGLIILADLYKGYWFGSRQVLHLLPVTIILTAIGLESLLALTKEIKLFQEKYRKPIYIGLSVIALAAVGVMGLVRVDDYYHWQKSSGEQVVEELLEVHEAGQPIYVIPGYDEKVLRFYFMDKDQEEHIGDLKSISWDGLPEATLDNPEVFYLVTRAKVTRDQEALLGDLFYENYTDLDGLWYGAHALYVNKGK